MARKAVTTALAHPREGDDDQLQLIESEADEVLLDQLRGLYSNPSNTLRAVFLKDLFELLEKVADRCRDAGNVINLIVLKNS